MNTKLLVYLEKQSAFSLISTGFVLVGIIGFTDYLTGYELSFSIFYLIPVLLVTWYVNRPAGIVMSVAGAAVWLMTDLLAGHIYTHPVTPYWNGMVRLGFFLIVTYMFAALQASWQRKEQLIAELQTTLTKVKLLEGILPVCSFCKKIRDKDNRWNSMEGYLMEHSEAQFSHTFCPECGKKHYPEYYGDSQAE